MRHAHMIQIGTADIAGAPDLLGSEVRGLVGNPILTMTTPQCHGGIEHDHRTYLYSSAAKPISHATSSVSAQAMANNMKWLGRWLAKTPTEVAEEPRSIGCVKLTSNVIDTTG